MATDCTHVPTQASVSEVLKLVVLEHRELRAQYKEVTTRIRNLRVAVKTLRSLGGRNIHTSRRGEVKGSTGEKEVPREGSKVEPGPDPGTSPTVDSEGVALRRAVRIAVFETFEVVSTEDVHTRIRRRGSFWFPNAQLASQAIEEELKAMSEEGELRPVESPSGSRWQRL